MCGGIIKRCATVDPETRSRVASSRPPPAHRPRTRMRTHTNEGRLTAQVGPILYTEPDFLT